jgi:hypothetical protein
MSQYTFTPVYGQLSGGGSLVSLFTVPTNFEDALTLILGNRTSSPVSAYIAISTDGGSTYAYTVPGMSIGGNQPLTVYKGAKLAPGTSILGRAGAGSSIDWQIFGATHDVR